MVNKVIENNQLSTIEYLHNREKFSNSSLSLTLLLTMDCNLRCIYCYEGAGIVSKEKMDESKYNRLYKFIISQLESRNIRNLSICLFGGEPTLEINNNSKNFLDRIDKYCKANQIKFITSIVTNGTYMSDEIIKNLKKFNCVSIQITLDGTKEVHDTRRITPKGKGSFDICIRNIIKLVKSDLPNPAIRINIDKTNLENIKKLLDYLYSLKLNVCPIDFGIVKANTDVCSDFDENCIEENDLANILYELWGYAESKGFDSYNNPSRTNMFCGLYSDSSFTITPDLKLYKCWEFVNQSEHVIAEIDEKGDITEFTESYFNWMNRNPVNIKSCRECAYLPVCAGGCASLIKDNKNLYNKPGCHKVKGVYDKEVIKVFEKISSYNG